MPTDDSRGNEFVWLLGPAGDPHIHALARAVERRGFRALHTPSREAFPICFDIRGGTGSHVGHAPISACAGVFVHRLPPRHRLPPEDPWSRDTLYVSQMEADAWRDTTIALIRQIERAGANILSAPTFGFVRTPKLEILQDAESMGLRIPQTIVTSDSDAGADATRHFGQTVAKPVRGGAEATLMLPGDERLARLRRAPVTLQYRIFGPDIRAFLLDGQILSSARLSGFTDEYVDFRRDPTYSKGQTTYEHFQIDEETQRGLRNLMAKLQVRFCGIDLKAADDGLVFLEMNLAPAYLEQEVALGDEVTSAVADALCAP